MGIGQEHLSVAGDVCTVELVDGAQTNIAGAAGMSAPAAQAKTRKLTRPAQESMKSAANLALVLPCEHSRINSRCGGVYADLPQALSLVNK